MVRRWNAQRGCYVIEFADRQRIEAHAQWCLTGDLEALDREEHPLLVCAAPTPRSDTTCGRWFVRRRRDQTYCSPICQNRAALRAFRARS
jgi:hypothetical protein